MRCDFAFQSTLSGRTYLHMLQNAKQEGYRVHLCYLWLPSVSLCLRRIKQRVRKGGHDVPPSDERQNVCQVGRKHQTSRADSPSAQDARELRAHTRLVESAEGRFPRSQAQHRDHLPACARAIASRHQARSQPPRRALPKLDQSRARRTLRGSAKPSYRNRRVCRSTPKETSRR